MAKILASDSITLARVDDGAKGKDTPTERLDDLEDQLAAYHSEYTEKYGELTASQEEFSSTLGEYSATVDGLTDTLYDRQAGGQNLFVLSDSVPGYIHSGNGSIVRPGAVLKERTSNFIPVESGENYVLQCWATVPDDPVADNRHGWLAYAFYDAGKAFQSRPSQTQTPSAYPGPVHLTFNITVPEGAVYMRVSARTFDDGLIKLEKGTTGTDRTPTPQDLEQELFDAKTELSEQQTQILQDANSYTTQALSDYTLKTEFESYQKSVSTRFEQTADDFNMRFDSAEARTTAVEGEVSEFKSDFHTYIRFSGDGLELGEENGQFGAKLGRERLSFTQGGEEIAYLSNNRLYITEAYATSAVTVGDDNPDEPDKSKDKVRNYMDYSDPDNPLLVWQFVL